MTLQKDIISTIKLFIDNGNILGLKNYYQNLNQIQVEYDINYQYIYKDVFLYSCIKKQKKIMEWLTEVYHRFDDVTRIALKHIFTYGKYLLMRQNKKDLRLVTWYQNNILDNIKCY